MNHLKTPLVPLALLLSALAMPAMSASSTASSASDSASSATSSASDSLGTSSNGSSKATKTVATGDYQIIDVATVPERPGTVRMTLQAVADRSVESEFFLYVPQQTVDRTQLAAGQIVAARQRPYGVEFANGEPKQAFFLVLDDAWVRDLPSHAVAL